MERYGLETIRGTNTGKGCMKVSGVASMWWFVSSLQEYSHHLSVCVLSLFIFLFKWEWGDGIPQVLVSSRVKEKFGDNYGKIYS